MVDYMKADKLDKKNKSEIGQHHNFPEFYFVGELRLKNHEIFRFVDREKGDKGFIIIEDCNRPATIDDYEFLRSKYPNLEAMDLSDSDNVIKGYAIMLEKPNEDEATMMLNMTLNLFKEFREHVDTLFSIKVEPELVNRLLDEINDYPFECYTELLTFTEKKPDVSHYLKQSLKRLFQEDPLIK